jgi:hypothetical protein
MAASNAMNQRRLEKIIIFMLQSRNFRPLWNAVIHSHVRKSY